MLNKCCNCGVSISHTFPNGQTYNLCPKCLMSWYDTGDTEPVVQSAKIDKEPKVKKFNEKTLYFQDEKSDKVYKAWIEKQEGFDWYQVKAAYGRRGGALTETSKQHSIVPENAQYHLNMLIAEKKAKGYKENLAEAYSPLNETAATPNQLKFIKSFGLVVPPGLTKKQAQFMVEQYQNKNKPSDVYPSPGKPGSMQPPTLVKPPAVPKKEEPLVVSGPTGRRIKEVD